MSGKSITFDDKNILKSNFFKKNKLFKIDDVHINQILSSRKEPHSTNNSINYSIGYNDHVTRPLCIKLPQIIGYVKCFDGNKTMSVKVNDKKLLKECHRIWERVSNLMTYKIYSEPAHGDNVKYIKKKVKIYGDKVNTNFQNKRIPKENTPYKCLSLIMLDSVIKTNHPQTLLEERKYEIKKRIKWRILLMVI